MGNNRPGGQRPGSVQQPMNRPRGRDQEFLTAPPYADGHASMPHNGTAPPERPQVQPEYLNPFSASFARIKVIGVGGAGGNAVNRMVTSGVEGVEFVAVNTDAQALMTSEAPMAIRIGDKLTRGLGVGGRPDLGHRAAEESAEHLGDLMRDTDMIFITAGMGGGTGTGASPVIAKLAKAAGALTVGVVTKPFEFEGSRRRRSADEGINALRDTVDALIVIPNERLLHMVDPKTTVTEAFRLADDVLRQGIAGISDLIIKPGIINLDFADVKTIMQDAGSALMAIGHGTGETRCIDAAKEAIESPLLEMNIQGATGVLYNITGGSNLTLIETSEAAEIIRAAADDDAEIIYGTSIDDELGDSVMITLIATGFDDRRLDDYQAPVRQPYREPYREPFRERERERPYRPPQPAAAAPRQAVGGPMMPDEDWGGEPSIIKFLRDR